MFAFDPPPQPPPIPQNPACIIVASAYYNVPPEALMVIRMVEGGKPGTISRNDNGTADYGPNQINTVNMKIFEQYGISRTQITHDECVNTAAAAYLLRAHLDNERGDIWAAMGDYHSKTPRYANIYRTKLAKKLKLIHRDYMPYLTWMRIEVLKLRGSWEEYYKGILENKAGGKHHAAPGNPQSTGLATVRSGAQNYSHYPSDGERVALDR